jgi:hypothetical protein
VSYASPYGAAPSPEPTSGYKSPYGAPADDKKQAGYKSPYGPPAAEKKQGGYKSPYADTLGKKVELAPPLTETNKAIGGAFELIQRPVEAAFAKVTRGKGYWDVLQHGEPPAQFNADRNQVYGALSKGNRNVFTGKPEPFNNPVAEAVVETAVNPLSYLNVGTGGRSIVSHATEAAERHGLPAVVKAGEHLPQAVTKPVAKAHDFLGVHSQAKRELAAEHGSAWLPEYARLRAKGMNLPHGEPIEDTQFQPARKNGKPVYGPGPAGGPPVQKGAYVPNPDADKLKTMKASAPYMGSNNPLQKGLQGASDFTTAGMFALPFNHMANISGLGLLADPAAVAKAFGRGTVQNVKKAGLGAFGAPESAAELEARHTGPRVSGAVGRHPETGTTDVASHMRPNPLDTLLTKAAEGLERGGIPGKIAASIPKAVRGLFRWSSDTLWKFDDEVKAQRWEHLVDGGMDPFVAGTRVGGELVDYESKSPLAKSIRPIAPFSTWRTKAPLAMGRNVVENPGRAAFLSSLAPAMFGGQQGTDAETGKPFVSSLPGSELSQALADPWDYAVRSTGPIPRLIQDAYNYDYSKHAPNPRTRKQGRTLATYGKEPLEFAENEFPLASTLLQYTKHGMFRKGKDMTPQEMLLSLIRARSK